jgi:two-component system OmpR family response regulator
MKILVVDDDVRMAQFVSRALHEHGYVVRHAANGQEGLELALAEPFDAAVVDIMLPGLDGLSLIRGMRAQKVLTPVIVLSAKSGVDDRVKGLQAGGDDYLVKPFALAELLARIQALLRRASAAAEPVHITVGPLSIDLVRHRVACEGREIDLQPREYSLLEYLMRNAGRVVSKSMIMERVWEYNFDPQTNVVEARICRLRDKIDRVAPLKLIHTVRGVGYVLETRP